MDRLSRLVVREEIRQLKARYSQAMNRRDRDGYADVFTADAVIEMGTIRAEGREAIVEFVRDALRKATTSHISHSPIIEVLSADAARATWSAAYVQDGDRLTGWGYYEETYAREDDGVWRIASTHLVTTMFRGTDTPRDALIEA
jgi:uncharacterized protein (TIGR02246 family)